jgi:hypothetical protein
MSQGTILIFRIHLLAPSETFIVEQAAAMRRFSPYFVGWRRMAGIPLPNNTSWTVDGGGLGGRLRELRFRYAGPAREQIAHLRARDSSKRGRDDAQISRLSGALANTREIGDGKQAGAKHPRYLFKHNPKRQDPNHDLPRERSQAYGNGTVIRQVFDTLREQQPRTTDFQTCNLNGRCESWNISFRPLG